MPARIQERLYEARVLVEREKFDEAEKLYRKLLSYSGSEDVVYRELFQFYVRQNRPKQAMSCLEEMARFFEDVPEWWHQLAQYAQSLGDLEKAIFGYQMFLGRVPDRPNSVYNLAYLLKQVGKLHEALTWYKKSLAMGISGEEEVYTNMGVILSELRREPEARDCYHKALEIRDDYLPAILNLAALFEEAGDQKAAATLYGKALVVDAKCVLAMCRLAYLTTADHSGEPLIHSISTMLKNSWLTKSESEELNFSLGKLLDDCGEYEGAFSRYSEANRLGQSRFSPYQKNVQSQYIDNLISSFSGDVLSVVGDSPDRAPIFICGMFRSGSTLVEQVLSGHSDITSGGELEFFPRLVAGLGDRYPGKLESLGVGFYQKVGRDYLDFLSDRFAVGSIVTDKRPDNFLHVGLIKRALPNARFIWTRRGLLDNCLSVYFQQLGGGMNYSVDLDAIGHFYVEQERLMHYWQSLFPGSILEVGYESLVMSPEKEVRRILDFLGVAWEEGCLEFQRRNNYVKTASVWQVRNALHTGSIGRFKNYQPYISVLNKYLQGNQ
ncbi:tetratricopeptide repeat-containing sulfotransferase family protein [Microbulbifer sp. ARAS458-1]|uniref:tetratricopeptide repeat-containing sulfotransferase family protein n=1 Tax=Microbulbifer sp. ARAS458-1 TaxID=3140242 RepID=UPI0038781EB7